ncbi:MAG: phosphatidate cytidylyltransferase [Candidatus Baltobacteraceae bacterium]
MRLGNLELNPELLWASIGALGILALATVAGKIVGNLAKDQASRNASRNFDLRIRAWWIIALIFGLTLLFGPNGSLVIFGVLSFLALREYITLVPTRRADHHTLFWTFFIFTPLEYYLLSIGWTGFMIVIPVYAFLFIPAAMALAGDTQSFLERAAKIQWGLMICVYCLSYAPALLLLQIHGFGPNAKLLLFLILVAELSDVMQFVWGTCFGRHPIAPAVAPNRTWEGFIGGTLSATLLGAALWWLTPFTPAAAGAISLLIAVLGSAGGLVISALKRDRGATGYGSTIAGQGGILDRMDSIVFAAPVFFHVVRFFYGS